MKQFFLFLTVSFFTISTVFSTEQYPDKLIIGEDTIYLKSFPLESLRLENAPFDYNGYSFPSTGCYRGYVATWQIVDESLTLKEIQKIDSVGTQLNIVEYLSNNGYIPQTTNGCVIADWYSDTLKLYEFFAYNLAYKFDEFYVGKDYLREKDKKIELVFENGKLIRNDIIPIEDYKLGDTLCLDMYYYQNWLIGYKSVLLQGVIIENNGKKVKLETLSLKTEKKSIKRKLQKEINSDYLWVNPRYCKKIE